MSWLREILESPMPLSKDGVLERAIEKACALPGRWELSRLFDEAKRVLPQVGPTSDVRCYFILSCIERLLPDGRNLSDDSERLEILIRLLAHAGRADRGWPEPLLTRWIGIIGRDTILERLPELYAAMPESGDRNLFALTVALGDERGFLDMCACLRNGRPCLRDLGLLVWARARNEAVAAMAEPVDSLHIDETELSNSLDGGRCFMLAWKAAGGCVEAFTEAMHHWVNLSRESLTATYEITEGELRGLHYRATTRAGTDVVFLARSFSGLMHYSRPAVSAQFLDRLRSSGDGSAHVPVLVHARHNIECVDFVLSELLERMSGDDADGLDLDVTTRLLPDSIRAD